MSTRKGRIQASIGNRGSGRIPKMWDPGEYREGINLGEYQRKTQVSIGKGRNPGEYQKNRNLGEYQRRTRVSTGRRIG